MKLKLTAAQRKAGVDLRDVINAKQTDICAPPRTDRELVAAAPKRRTLEQVLRRKLRGTLNSMVGNGCIRDYPTKDTIVEMVIVGVLEVLDSNGGAK